MANNAAIAAKINPKNSYLVLGSLLRKLIDRKIDGVQGEISVRVDADGNAVIGLAGGGTKFYGDENGQLSAWMIHAQPADPAA